MKSVLIFLFFLFFSIIIKASEPDTLWSTKIPAKLGSLVVSDDMKYMYENSISSLLFFRSDTVYLNKSIPYMGEYCKIKDSKVIGIDSANKKYNLYHIENSSFKSVDMTFVDFEYGSVAFFGEKYLGLHNSYYGTCKVYDLITKTEYMVFDYSNEAACDNVVITDSEDYIIGRGSLKLFKYDLNNKAFINRYEIPDLITGILRIFVPNDSLVILYSESIVKIVNINSNQELFSTTSYDYPNTWRSIPGNDSLVLFRISLGNANNYIFNLYTYKIEKLTNPAFYNFSAFSFVNSDSIVVGTALLYDEIYEKYDIEFVYKNNLTTNVIDTLYKHFVSDTIIGRGQYFVFLEGINKFVIDYKSINNIETGESVADIINYHNAYDHFYKYNEQSYFGVKNYGDTVCYIIEPLTNTIMDSIIVYPFMSEIYPNFNFTNRFVYTNDGFYDCINNKYHYKIANYENIEFIITKNGGLIKTDKYLDALQNTQYKTSFISEQDTSFIFSFINTKFRKYNPSVCDITRKRDKIVYYSYDINKIICYDLIKQKYDSIDIDYVPNLQFSYNGAYFSACDSYHIKIFNTNDFSLESGVTFDKGYNIFQSGSLNYAIIKETDGIAFMLKFKLDVTSVESENTKKESSLTIYPNPATNIINIELYEQQIIEQIAITSNNGSNLKEYNNIDASKYQIILNELPTGVYYLRVTTENMVLTKKFIKL